MEAVLEKKAVRKRTPRPARKSRWEGRTMTLEQFMAWEPRTVGLKLEWNNGRIETEYRMKQSERIIIDNIVTRFNTTAAYKAGNRIMAEAEVRLSSVSTYRQPDACYLTREQIKSPDTASEVVSFIVEVISPSNTSFQVNEKVGEYFQADTQVVWLIYPDSREVWVFTGPKNVTICTDTDVCSAQPAVPELQMTVNEIFA